MKKTVFLLGFLAATWLAPPFACAAKLSSFVDNDAFMATRPSSLKQQPLPEPTSTPTAAAPLPAQAPASALSMPTAQIPAVTPTTPPLSPSSGFSTPAQPKPVRITVPDFEKKFQDMYSAETAKQEAKAKKKRKLTETIAEEIHKYALLLALAVVVLLIIHGLRKDKEQPEATTAAEPNKKAEKEKPKKTIWDEDF